MRDDIIYGFYEAELGILALREYDLRIQALEERR